MKFQLSLFLLIATFSLFAQDIETCNKKLLADFTKMEFYAERKHENDNYDSVEKYNDAFQNKLLKYCNSVPKTMTYPFKELTEIALGISTSQNGLFRIYSWNGETGGTMQDFRNVFQFKSGAQLYARKIAEQDDSDDNSFSYEIIDEVTSQKQTFYVVKCIAIGSSAASSHKIKIFSIENGKLNQDAKLIKTKTGIQNELAYWIDFSDNANLGFSYDDMQYAWIDYDKKTKTIAIPLITEAGKLTKKKIRYQFKGVYFEKI